jgi:hypothetical protein
MVELCKGLTFSNDGITEKVRVRNECGDLLSGRECDKNHSDLPPGISRFICLNMYKRGWCSRPSCPYLHFDHKTLYPQNPALTPSVDGQCHFSKIPADVIRYIILSAGSKKMQRVVFRTLSLTCRMICSAAYKIRKKLMEECSEIKKVPKKTFYMLPLRPTPSIFETPSFIAHLMPCHFNRRIRRTATNGYALNEILIDDRTKRRLDRSFCRDIGENFHRCTDYFVKDELVYQLKEYAARIEHWWYTPENTTFILHDKKTGLGTYFLCDENKKLVRSSDRDGTILFYPHSGTRRVVYAQNRYLITFEESGLPIQVAMLNGGDEIEVRSYRPEIQNVAIKKDMFFRFAESIIPNVTSPRISSPKLTQLQKSQESEDTVDDAVRGLYTP